jgi:hypothetical protein
LVEKRFLTRGQSGAGFRPLLVGGLAALVASLANPAGWRLWETSLGFLGSSYLVGHTAEYLPPNFHLKSAWPFLGMIVLSLLLLGRCRSRLPAVHLLLVAGWTAMALISARNIPLYAVLTAPALAAAALYSIGPDGMAARFNRLQERLRQVDQDLKGHLWAGIGVIILSASLANSAEVNSANQRNRFDPQVFPVAAVDWLERQPDLGQGFNFFSWGGYLLYRLWPDQRVFIDGQTDFYGEDLTRQYEQVITLQPGWEGILEQYGVRWVIMPPNSALVGALQSRPDWQLLYTDETAAILSDRR